MKKIYGPYKREDNRWIIIIGRVTKSYPRYLMEQHLGRQLKSWEEIDHIDCNPDNNELSNLRVLHKSTNASIASVFNSNCTGYKQSEEHKRSGEKNGKAKLTLAEVNEYRKLHAAKQISKLQIMKQTGLCRRAVENFLEYRSYKC